MILITGGLGFIGLHTARRFLDVGEQVVLTQYRMRREPDFIKSEIGKRAFIETLDVTVGHDVIDVVRRHKVTGIVHLAVPGLGALSAAEDYRVNMMGFLNILEAARLFDVRRVSLASSVAVYASLPEGPFREEALLPVHSGNPTETFKKALEILGLHYASRTNSRWWRCASAARSGRFTTAWPRRRVASVTRRRKGCPPILPACDAERRMKRTIPALFMSRIAPRLSNSSRWPKNCPTESTTSAASHRRRTGSLSTQ